MAPPAIPPEDGETGPLGTLIERNYWKEVSLLLTKLKGPVRVRHRLLLYIFPIHWLYCTLLLTKHRTNAIY